jgi:hypothetical protein
MLVSLQRAQIRRADAKLYGVSWVGPSWQRLNGRRHHKCDVSYALWPVDDEATGSPCAYAAVNADALDALQRVGTSVRPLSRYPLLSSPPPSHSSTEQYCGGCLRRTRCFAVTAACRHRRRNHHRSPTPSSTSTPRTLATLSSTSGTKRS